MADITNGVAGTSNTTSGILTESAVRCLRWGAVPLLGEDMPLLKVLPLVGEMGEGGLCKWSGRAVRPVGLRRKGLGGVRSLPWIMIGGGACFFSGTIGDPGADMLGLLASSIPP